MIFYNILDSNLGNISTLSNGDGKTAVIFVIFPMVLQGFKARFCRTRQAPQKC